MHLSSLLILAAAVSSSTAFAPFALTSGPRSATRASSAAVRLDAERGSPLPRVFPGVDLPSSADIPVAINHPFSNERQLDFTPPVCAHLSAMIGKPKSYKTFTTFGQNRFVATQNVGAQIPDVSEYKFFGNGNHSTNLEYLLKTNPFMATALTECDSGFELRAFDKDDPKAEDPSASLYRQLMSCLGGPNHRVNIRFDSDMSIRQIRVYDEIEGDVIKIIRSDEEEFDYWASSALFNLSYYASCVHANIHVLHYILTAALDESSRDFGAMNEWAKFYATNIPDKYLEVSMVLIRDQPNNILNILPPLSPDTSCDVVHDTYALLTGSAGYGADGEMLRSILEKLLNVWTSDPTNYLENMLNVPKEKMMEAGVLTEFMKHHDMIPDFARDVAEALKSTDGDKFGIAEDRLKLYLKRCSGITSRIDSLENWIELMAVTGIVHGATLSYSRLFADADILRWRSSSDTWQISDAFFHANILGTICGMDEHRHVMSSSTDVVGEEYDEKLQAVLETYEQKANDLKEAYKNQIMENTGEFNNYGWILSDFCPDGFDGKQLTVTSYI